MSADHTPGHGGNSGLCAEDHFCHGCVTGGACVDLFTHPICGLVACCTDEPRVIPTKDSLLAGLAATTADDAKDRWDRVFKKGQP